MTDLHGRESFSHISDTLYKKRKGREAGRW